MADIPDEQMEECKAAFKMFDKDGNGYISQKELATVMRSLGQNPTDAEVKGMIAEQDTNRDGYIEFREFMDMMGKRGFKSQQMEEDELKTAFKVFDRDGNGFITTSELRHAMTNLGECMSDAEVQDMIAEADVNGDGMVNYEEFSKIMSS